MFGDTVTWTGIPRVFTGPNMGDGAGQSFGTFTNSEGVAFASIIASFSPYPSDAIQYSAEFWPLWQDFFLADPSSCPTPGAPTCLYNNVAYAEAAADALFKPLGEGGIGLLYTSINIDPAPWFMASQYSSYCHAYSSDTVSLGTACFKPPTSPTNYQAILTRALGTYTEVLNYIQSAYPQVQIHFSPVPSISLWNTCKLTTAASRTEAAVEACFGPLYQTMVANVATARVTALHEPAGAWALFCGACPFLSSPANVDTFLQNASTAIKTVSPSTKVGAGGAYPDMGISGGVYTCPNTGGSLNYWCDYTTVDASFLDYVGMDLYPATNTSASYAALVGTPSGGMSGGLAATYTSMAQAAQAAHLPIYINESSALRWSFPGTGPGTTPGAESDTYLGSGWSGWTVTNAWSDWLAAVPVAWAEYMGIVGWDYIDTPALTCQSTDPNNTHTCPDCTQTQTGTPLPDTFMPTCMASLPSVSTYGTMYGTLASRNPFAAQTVAFGPLSDQPFGTAPFPVGATASSGLAVSFASITPAVCTISGATVTLVAAGTCAIRATQAGNTIYAAAPPVYQSFHVTQGSQTIAFGALSDQPFGTAPFPVSATATSGLAVSFASTTPACTVSGATVTLVSAGTCTIQATQAGNANYAAATPVSQSFQVTAASQTIAFGALANQPYGSASFPVSATATSGLAVSFASTTPACTMSGATVTLVSVGTCTIQATQAGNNNYTPATPVNQSFSVTQEGQVITFGPLTDQVLGSAPITVNATASSGLPVAFASITPAVCTVSGNTVTLAGAGQCSIQAVQPGNLSYLAAAPVTQSFQAAQETLGIASLTVASAGGSDSVEIGFLPQLAAPSWSATANAAWLHLGSGSGTGAAILAFSCDPNPSTTVRSGAITLDSGVALTVTQAGSDYMGPGAAVALASAGLSGPVAVAVDGSGNVYLADTGNNAIKEWSAATQQVTTLVSTGLNQPAAVAVDNSGNVYIADTGNHAIKQWNATTQQVTALVSTGLNQPVGVAVDGSGNVYIADSLNNAIEVWNAMTQQVTALVSTGLNQPVGVAVDGSGNVYIADSLNDAIEEWSAATQQVTTLVSTGVNQPAGVAVDGSGNVYMAYSKSAAIAEWSAATQQVTTLVSTGLQQPVGVAVDGSGNVYIADAGNNAVEEIPWVFVGPASLTEPVTGGTDALLPVLPATTSLVGIFAPASNQGWLSIGSVANGVVGFSFTANSSTAARTAQINVLGQQIAVTQNGLTVQTIAFGALANQPYGTAPFPVSATATSGLAVSFASTTPACTVSGATVTLVSAGTCTIQATQAGNANYAAATPVSQSFQVTAASQTIAFGALANQPYGSASFPVSATATSGLAVSFASTTPACTMSGATVTLVSVGTCTIQATQAGNNNYTPATPVNQSFSVTQEGQVITFGPLTDQVLGSAPITVNATASSGLPVAFASITPAVCTVSGNTVTLAGAGQCSIQAVQPGNLSYLAAAPVTQSFQAAQETLGIASLTVASAGGSDSVEIGFLPQLAAPSWSATANAAWLHLGSGSGTGAAILAFSCDPNPSTTVRSGAITLDSGVALTVTQAGSDYMGPGAAVALASAGLSGPVAVAVDGSGNVYLADTGNNAIKEWSAATQQVTTLVSTGLNQPAAVAVDNSGNVYIADTGNHAIKQWNATTQQVTALVSTGLNQPVGVAVDGSGNVYIADSLNNAIEVWNAMTQQVTALVSTGLNQPVGVAVDGSGNVYIADSLNDAIEEWSAATQQVTTLVSTGVNQPAGVAVDGSGNVYMAYSKSAAIAEWSAATQQVTTLVSTGLQQPVGVAVDGSGNVYIADAGNNAVEEIPWVFVGPASLTEPVTGGTDALLPVLPATTSLVGIFAPASNQGWLSIGSVANGVVGFSFTANSSTAARTAQINVLGQQIAVTQNGLTVQTIAFGALANQPYGSAPFPVSATATSGLAVSFASTTPACTVSGATVTLVSAGTCTIQATQAGNANYAAATPVSQSFQVTAASQTIAFGALANQPYGSAPFPVGATATSGLAVSFASTTPACAMSGATVSLVSAGTCTIQATQAGNANYAAATPVSQSFQVTAASQTIAFGALANQPYGSAPFPVGATASSGLAVSFASTTRAVCTVSGATVTLAAGGTCTIQATQAGNANYAAATPVNQTFQVTPASQTITFGVLANQPLGTSPFPVSATASSGLAVSFASTTPSVCTVSSATVTLVAAGTCTIQARQAGNANYAAATPVNQSFQVQRSQTITFGALSNRAFGSAPFTVSATASSGLAVSFASTTSAVCTTSGATVTLAAAGTCTIQATQAGNTNYAAATPVNQSFQVTQASQTITFGALSNRAFGSAPFTVSATASSGLAVSFASTTSAVCTTSGATVTLVAAGTCTIQATQAGNANYAAATPVNRSFQVTPKSQTIAFGALSNRAFGSAPFTVSATASSGLAVSFASTTSAVCTTSGATVTLVAAGTCTIQATQAGNANWTAATPVNQSFQVTPASQTITFGALSKRAFGSAPFTVSATASSGLAVSFASTTSAVCTTSGATVTLAAAGTCTIQATQAGNANYAAATPVSQSFQVTPASQTITFGALSNRAFGSAPFAVAATASSGLAVSFNSQTTKVCGVSGTTVTLLATGACTIQATQAGNANWAAATPVNQSFQVTQGSQTITFGALSNQTLGTPPFTVSATASSGFAVSFASATTAVCTVSGSTVTLVAAGTCTIKATQPGNANWAAATPVNQSFQVK
jgi:DNA-binding beta-propeller fold protein YncE